MTVFDLEQKIMDCWGVIDDISIAADSVESGNEDETLNILIGLKSLYNRKFENLFSAYEQFLSENRK